MRYLLLLALLGSALAGCANDHPPKPDPDTIAITPAPVGPVTQVPLSQPQASHTP